LFTSSAVQLDVSYHLAGPIILIFDVSSYSLLHPNDAKVRSFRCFYDGQIKPGMSDCI